MANEIEKIHKRLGNSSWALTGSWALWFHSLHAQKVPRAPHDINIAVSPNARQYVTSQLMSLGWSLENHGRVRSKFSKGPLDLDLIVAGSHLAPNLRNVVRRPHHPPIVSIKGLLNRKLAITSNENFNLEKNANKRKTLNNIKRLREL